MTYVAPSLDTKEEGYWRLHCILTERPRAFYKCLMQSMGENRSVFNTLYLGIAIDNNTAFTHDEHQSRYLRVALNDLFKHDPFDGLKLITSGTGINTSYRHPHGLKGKEFANALAYKFEIYERRLDGTSHYLHRILTNDA